MNRSIVAILAIAALLGAGAAAADPGRNDARRWYDGAHGHNRTYPAPGAPAPVPSQARSVYWGGVGYHYHAGVWYAPGRHGPVVVRPPHGIVIHERPAWATVLLIGGLTYLYANGIYYREIADRGYEVVPPPVDGAAPPLPPAAPTRLYVYPRMGQSPEQQRSDDFECHRWAASQTGYDPSQAATGQGPAGDALRRTDYDRARTACLEGRGYTVR